VPILEGDTLDGFFASAPKDIKKALIAEVEEQTQDNEP
jgi:hypothetical protein